MKEREEYDVFDITNIVVLKETDTILLTMTTGEHIELNFNKEKLSLSNENGNHIIENLTIHGWTERNRNLLDLIFEINNRENIKENK